MKEKENFNSLASLGSVKEELANQEPVREGHITTPEMLQSPVSKKLLKYFFDTYPEVLARYTKKDSSRQEIIKTTREILSSDKSLSEQNIFYLDDLYLLFIKKVPITRTGNNGILFGKISRDAGCTGPEIEEAKKLLNSYIEPALKKMFGN